MTNGGAGERRPTNSGAGDERRRGHAQAAGDAGDAAAAERSSGSTTAIV